MGNQIDEVEAREIVSLIGSVAMMDAPRNGRRIALMDGLGQMINADAWLWFTSAHTTEGEQPAHTIILRHGFSDEQFALMIEASESPDMAHLTAPFFHDYNETGGHTTRLRQQIVSNEVFNASEVYGLWHRANIGPVILSACPTSEGQVSTIGLYRNFDKPAFSERESRIAHIILSEIPSLHENISPSQLNGSVAALTPRLRQVLNCLLQGYSRKEIASHLNLSIHTVGEYVTELYKRFDVHSQTDLVRRFLAGDGGDIPLLD
ncbi:MAG: helix-turn-helix transcriptional regulator [Verrucomicrobiales bacterium]|nr:helix-turn-helix transcriptional regulator [Verrucomicrobiales bacterium]